MKNEAMHTPECDLGTLKWRYRRERGGVPIEDAIFRVSKTVAARSLEEWEEYHVWNPQGDDQISDSLSWLRQGARRLSGRFEVSRFWPRPSSFFLFPCVTTILAAGFLLLVLATGWPIPVFASGQAISKGILGDRAAILAPMTIALIFYCVVLVLTQTPSAVGLLVVIPLSGAVGVVCDLFSSILIWVFGIGISGGVVVAAGQTILAWSLLLVCNEPRTGLRYPFDHLRPIALVVGILSGLSLAFVVLAETQVAVQSGFAVIASVFLVTIGFLVTVTVAGAILAPEWESYLGSTSFLVVGVASFGVVVGGASPFWLQVAVLVFLGMQLEQIFLRVSWGR